MTYRQLIFLSALCLPLVASAEKLAELIPFGADWNYNDSGAAVAANWASPEFDDGSWPSGAGQLGYGDNDEATELASNRMAYFFRSSFELDELAEVRELEATLLYDDGAIVYLNGKEVFRTKEMPNKNVDFQTSARTSSHENQRVHFNIDTDRIALRPGTNTIAVQVHNRGKDSSDISFDLRLVAKSMKTIAERFRVVWVDDPARTATIGWDQTGSGEQVVHYGPTDHGTDWQQYPFQQKIDRRVAHRGMNNCFARLRGLEPDTAYYFVIRGGVDVTQPLWFRTAADEPQPFHFIAGGDSRNIRKARLAANRMVAKLRPLFVAFTGDMINRDNDGEWFKWLNDWQATISPDGRIYPLLPHRGNHETGGNSTVYNLFDTTESNYYALSFNAGLARFYVLNSETPEGGEQGKFLEQDLAHNAARHRHLMAGYHKPMRPHTSAKKEGTGEYRAWAQIFYDYGMDLVFEADTHAIKRTVPLRPFTGSGSEEGFIADPDAGTVYVGEGCWGAPLRAANDNKSWTLASDSFNGFHWVHVYPEQIEMFTMQVDGVAQTASREDSDVFALPTGIDLWAPESGARYVVNAGFKGIVPTFAAWQIENFGASIPAQAQPDADADGDGISNLSSQLLISD